MWASQAGAGLWFGLLALSPFCNQALQSRGRNPTLQDAWFGQVLCIAAIGPNSWSPRSWCYRGVPVYQPAKGVNNELGGQLLLLSAHPLFL